MKDVENASVVQAGGVMKFGLSLQKVSWSLAVELVDLFTDSMDVVSDELVNSNASL